MRSAETRVLSSCTRQRSTVTHTWSGRPSSGTRACAASSPWPHATPASRTWTHRSIRQPDVLLRTWGVTPPTAYRGTRSPHTVLRSPGDASHETDSLCSTAFLRPAAGKRSDGSLHRWLDGPLGGLHTLRHATRRDARRDSRQSSWGQRSRAREGARRRRTGSARMWCRGQSRNLGASNLDSGGGRRPRFQASRAWRALSGAAYGGPDLLARRVRVARRAAARRARRFQRSSTASGNSTGGRPTSLWAWAAAPTLPRAHERRAHRVDQLDKAPTAGRRWRSPGR